MKDLAEQPMCYVDLVRFQQEADGYDKNGDVQNLLCELFPGDCVILKTERWACNAKDLRKLADKIEKLLKCNDALNKYLHRCMTSKHHEKDIHKRPHDGAF